LPAQCSFSECCSLPMPWHVVRESWRFLGQGVTPLRHLGCDYVVVTLSALSAWPKLHRPCNRVACDGWGASAVGFCGLQLKQQALWLAHFGS
jgi:hypothetical protein